MDRKDIHMLRLMGEIDRDGSPSQRELARRLNLSLGLINTFCKRLVSKGYFKVKTMPKNRVKYFLTPEGLARKSRLTVEYLRYSGKFYKEVKELLISKFAQMEFRHVKLLLFFGAGEVADLAYLYLQLTGIRLVDIVDETCIGDHFFHLCIKGPERLKRDDWDAILLTRLDNADSDAEFLIQNGVSPDRIEAI
ncbi:MAG: winged helix-turn-helix transcriptional regulator [Deltaproteobacteria bacterium]|nr:winged helix-turn-helix transcriptional regulator [Deltaproteobacteria bacterium]